ncbi:efflux RND transporter permease subunit [Nisaea sp.]|uniref:efflux RND transporter permease subunit n=1 Tax=Nisaea sp. TaxID=2024842 RepID=UPI003B5189CA
MNGLIRASIDRPVAVIAVVLMIVMFGIVALISIPIQLAPDVNRPVITVTTNWSGAAPAEIEREIINRQEDELRGLEGLESMIARAEDGRGRIELEFTPGNDMDKALLLVANRLDRVGGYPDEADEPTFQTSGSEDNAIAWATIMRNEGNDAPIHTLGDFAEDYVKSRIERIRGIGEARVYGGAEREMQVIVEPQLLAQYQLTIPEVLQALREANASISAGAVEEGKRRYVVRTEGDFETMDDVRRVVLRSIEDPMTGRVARVTVDDVATVEMGYKEPVARIRQFGVPALAIPMYRETGANVIEVMEEVRATLKELNEGILASRGLRIVQVYDETTYIDSAIELVRQNIWVGGMLAALVLYIFLRSGSATLVVSLAIPVSVIGSFVAMAALGRSINVISLAGFAFAVGMVVDAAIVVLENIFRLRQNGFDQREASYLGAQQVWGAVLVSSLTTVMVFIPILVMELEVGQLFRDIAVAISVAVCLSLLVSATVVPALASRLLKKDVTEIAASRRIPLLDGFARGFVGVAMRQTRAVVRNRMFAIMVIAGMTGGGIAVTWAMLPQLDYLPDGNRNLVIGFVQPPPGYNLDTMAAIAEKLESATKPLWDFEETRSNADDGTPMLSRFFFVAFRANVIVGAAAVDPLQAKGLIPVLRRSLFSEPGTFGFFRQTSLFGRGVGGTSAIDLDISGGELEELAEVAQSVFQRVNEAFPREEGTQIRPQPSLSLGAPEVRVLPNRTLLADNGVTARNLGITVDAYNDGVRVAEITVQGERIDLTLQGPERHILETQGVRNLPVVTSEGKIVPAGSLADVIVTTGPTEIRHVERLRTITLVVSPPSGMPLEAALNRMRDQVIEPMQAEGLPPGVSIRMSGTADKLAQTWNEMVLDLIMALIIVYLVMAVLFESFFYPLVIIFSVPLATAGGVVGLAALNLFTRQNLDMLTLLGFVILIGIVVNNAILLVHQTLHNIREDRMEAGQAIIEAARNRIRPIFMSTLTSVLGMLPLVIFPGAGSELYRGLGSVVIGGLALSALLTLGIIPPLLSLTVGLLESVPRPGRATDAGTKQAAE